MSLAKLGTKLGPPSEESNMKRRLAMTGRKITKAHRMKIRLVNLGRKRGPHTADAKRRISESNIATWKSKGSKQRYKTIKGYIMVKAENHPYANSIGYIFEHRLLMEKHIGRYLKKREEIHHLNEIRDDNRLENLKLCKTHKEHMQFHIKHPQSISKP
jgi:hypothetical protein